jgi:hypothetical protein
MAAADEQYGNKGYGQIGSQGGNPYDERDQNPAGDRYNNFSQGPYDDRTSSYLYRSTHERATAWLEERRSFVCSARKRCLGGIHCPPKRSVVSSSSTFAGSGDGWPYTQACS